jgi:hypothetical protein
MLKIENSREYMMERMGHRGYMSYFFPMLPHSVLPVIYVPLRVLCELCELCEKTFFSLLTPPREASSSLLTPPEMEHPAAISGIFQFRHVDVTGERAPVVDSRQLHQIQAAEVFQNLPGRVNAMPVETEPRSSRGQREKKVSSGSEHTGKFTAGFMGSPWIEGVAITSQSDMLGHMQAGERADRTVGIRHFKNAPPFGIQILQYSVERTDIDESDMGHRGEEPHEIDARSHIHMLFRSGFENPPKSPDILIEIMPVDAGGVRTVVDAGERIHETYRFGAFHPRVAHPIPEITEVPGNGIQTLDGIENGTDPPVSQIGDIFRRAVELFHGFS